MQENNVMMGVIITVIRDKGFCFIRGKDGLSRFGHVRDFISPTDFDLLHDGQVVEFSPMDLNQTGEIIRGNGLRAVRIKAIQNEN